jgi:hypothetical protein
MKVRLSENSIRLRLLQSEVEKVRKSGSVSEKIQFNQSQILTYTLKTSNDAAEISARYEEGEIVVEIPPDAARNWTETNLVGLEKEQRTSETATLKITIEKDFVCLDRAFDADNADAFPHPKLIC